MQMLDALTQLGMSQVMTAEVLRDLARSLAQRAQQGSVDAVTSVQSARQLLQQLDKAAQQGGPAPEMSEPMSL